MVPKRASDTTKFSLLPSIDLAVKWSAGRRRPARGATSRPAPQPRLRQGVPWQAPPVELPVAIRVGIAQL